jgi:hypothetical protein
VYEPNIFLPRDKRQANSEGNTTLTHTSQTVFNQISKEAKNGKKTQIFTQKKRKTRSKHFEKVLFYSFKIVSSTKTFSGLHETFSQ